MGAGGGDTKVDATIQSGPEPPLVQVLEVAEITFSLKDGCDGTGRGASGGAKIFRGPWQWLQVQCFLWHFPFTVLPAHLDLCFCIVFGGDSGREAREASIGGLTIPEGTEFPESITEPERTADPGGPEEPG